MSGDDEQTNPKVLVLIGESPGRFSMNPAMPLSARAMKIKLQWLFGLDAYERALKFNLLGAWPGKAGKGDAWDDATAQRTAAALRTTFRENRNVDWTLVVLGRRAGAAFGARLGLLPYFKWQNVNANVNAVLLPHPTGINRWWNEEGNRRKAVRFARRLARETRQWSR